MERKTAGPLGRAATCCVPLGFGFWHWPELPQEHPRSNIPMRIQNLTTSLAIFRKWPFYMGAPRRSKEEKTLVTVDDRGVVICCTEYITELWPLRPASSRTLPRRRDR